jgi:hypothetical protein
MEQTNGHTGLPLVDHFKCHLLPSFINACNKVGLDVDYIPKGYTCVLQPVDVGFNAPLKHWVRNCHHEWCLDKYPKLVPHQKIPLPTNDDIMQWINYAYDKITPQLIIKTFKHIGYNVQGMPKNIELKAGEMGTISDVTNDGFSEQDSDVVDYRDIFLRRVSENNDYESSDDDSSQNEDILNNNNE